MKSTEQGFTLIELMVTVAVVGILSAIAYPSYQQYVTRTHRTEAQTVMMSQAQAQERLMTNTGAYASQTINSPEGSSDSDRRYLITVTPASGSYSITAAPEARQNDEKCGTLKLDSVGRRGISGSGSVSDCWKS